MSEGLVCAKCGSKMETGWLSDNSEYARCQSTWVSGDVERAPALLGLVKPITLKDKTMRLVVAYRCIKCGYLEFYARQEITHPNEAF